MSGETAAATAITPPPKTISPIDTPLISRLPRDALGRPTLLFSEPARLSAKEPANLFQPLGVSAIGQRLRKAEGTL
jgi:hypothetical protein